MIVLLSVREVWSRRGVFVDSLCPAEREVFAGLVVEKRASDWLAGRIAAKRAVQRMTGLSFRRIAIVADGWGRPEVIAPSEALVFVSISHSGDMAVATAEAEPIGIDIERVEARDRSFEDLVLTATDRSEVAGLRGREREDRLTRIWSEKEAYAKLDGRGLRIPFAELEVPRCVRVVSEVVDGESGRFWIAVARGHQAQEGGP
jgi:4'-phosphopantetheinyl transferase